MEVPIVPEVKYLDLSGESDCRIAYTYRTVQQSESQDVIWIVFVNGLGLPQAFWQPCLHLLEKRVSIEDSDVKSTKIIATTYDRYAQGLSKIDNNGLPKRHDLSDATDELESIISQLQILHKEELSGARIVLVAHSLGVPLARLFLEKNTSLSRSTVAAIFLDSNIANLNMASLLPDPTSPDFDASKLPADTTVDELKSTRANYERMFAPSAPNPENLDRSTLADLLPFADQPKLDTISGSEFLLTVIAHDPAAFAMEGLKISTRGLTEQYIEPAWHKYNMGLLRLTGGDDPGADDIVVAPGAGHFIQRDNPGVVAEEIYKMLGSVCKL